MRERQMQDSCTGWRHLSLITYGQARRRHKSIWLSFCTLSFCKHSFGGQPFQSDIRANSNWCLKKCFEKMLTLCSTNHHYLHLQTCIVQNTNLEKSFMNNFVIDYTCRSIRFNATIFTSTSHHFPPYRLATIWASRGRVDHVTDFGF